MSNNKKKKKKNRVYFTKRLYWDADLGKLVFTYDPVPKYNLPKETQDD